MKPEDIEASAWTLLTAKQLADRYKISVQSVWRAVGEKRFPDPIYVAPRSPRWIAAVAVHRRSPKEAKAARSARSRRESPPPT